MDATSSENEEFKKPVGIPNKRSLNGEPRNRQPIPVPVPVPVPMPVPMPVPVPVPMPLVIDSKTATSFLELEKGYRL